jgi:hypothetical protein
MDMQFVSKAQDAKNSDSGYENKAPSGEKDSALLKLESNPIYKKLLSFLSAQPNSVTEKTILKIVSGNRQNKIRTLRILLGNRIVQRVGGGRRGDPYRYSIVPDHVKSPQMSPVEEILI